MFDIMVCFKGYINHKWRYPSHIIVGSGWIDKLKIEQV